MRALIADGRYVGYKQLLDDLLDGYERDRHDLLLRSDASQQVWILTGRIQQLRNLIDQPEQVVKALREQPPPTRNGRSVRSATDTDVSSARESEVGVEDV
jgi:hypothetical protein